MNGDRSLIVIRLVALLLLALGIGSTVRSARSTSDALERIERKHADLDRLRALSGAVDSYREAVAAFEALPAKRPRPLKELLRIHFPNSETEVRTEETRPAGGNWNARRMSVRLDHVSLPALGRFLTEAEAQRPPWRLSECNITASERGEDLGRVALIMEGLEKVGS